MDKESEFSKTLFTVAALTSMSLLVDIETQLVEPIPG